MRCKKCPKRKRTNGPAKCWDDYGLCNNCFKGKQSNEKTPHKICECGNMTYSLGYTYLGKKINSGMRICVKCNIVYMLDRYKVTHD